MPQPPDQGQLEDRWSALQAPDKDSLDGARVDSGHGPQAYLAVDQVGVRHLLIQIVDDRQVAPARPARGLEVHPRRIAVGDGPQLIWLDLSCPDASGHTAFTALAQELLAALPADVGTAADAVRAGDGVAETAAGGRRRPEDRP